MNSMASKELIYIIKELYQNRLDVQNTNLLQ